MEDTLTDEITFRSWNHKRIYTALGEDHRTPNRQKCPSKLICCHLVERSMNQDYKEVIEFCEEGSKTADEVFDTLLNQEYKRAFKVRVMVFCALLFSFWVLLEVASQFFTWIPDVELMHRGFATRFTFFVGIMLTIMCIFGFLGCSWMLTDPITALKHFCLALLPLIFFHLQNPSRIYDLK